LNQYDRQIIGSFIGGITSMDRLLEKQLEKIKQKEEKILNKPENQFVKQNFTPMVSKIEEKIPSKLKDVLNTAFYKGFQLVFEKGNKYIEKTYSKDKLQLQYDLNNYAVDRKLIKKHLRNIDKPANKSNLLNSTISLVEGSVLGAFGVGIPDIPLFLSVIMKTIYETALSYGYDYESDAEKCYVLLLICGAMAKDEKQKEYNKQLEQLGKEIDGNTTIESSLDKQMKITAEVVSESLLTAKFIQGLPIIGVVGGFLNQSIVMKIGKYAALKYKKRYLLKKSVDLK
jgi:hypothetical protein